MMKDPEGVILAKSLMRVSKLLTEAHESIAEYLERGEETIYERWLRRLGAFAGRVLGYACGALVVIYIYNHWIK